MAAILNLLKMILAFFPALINLFGFGAETVDVELYADPSSGYVWEYSCDRTDVLILSGKYFVPDSSAILSSGGGTQKYTFREIGEGTVNITFEYTNSDTDEVVSKYIYTYNVDANGKITLLKVT